MQTYIPRSRPGQAIDSPVFSALLAEWDAFATCRTVRERLRIWSARHDPLNYESGSQLLDAALNGDDATRCSILEALAIEAPLDQIAMRLTIQALLPRLVHLVNRSNRSPVDIDDRAGTIMVIAHETVARTHPGTATTRYDLRLWSNIRKRYIRFLDSVDRSLEPDSHRLGMFGVISDSDPTRTWTGLHQRICRSLSANTPPWSESFELAELINWVAETAEVDEHMAQLVVGSRALGLPIKDLGGDESLSAQSLRQRRLRAERRLYVALAQRPAA